jgi:asparagine synthase (glutamine-hydrolysing)
VCGIAGALGPDRAGVERAAHAMCDAMVARGPDDAGIAIGRTPDGWLALGNRRLAVVDPTPAGHQPMRDPETGIVVVFNGMVYNARELRTQLAACGAPFRSSCDTEVVLQAYVRWGAACVRRLRGMFAFAAWDPRDRALVLARDPLGIKPLYYTVTNTAVTDTAGAFPGSAGLKSRPTVLAFASQVKALVAAGVVPAALDRQAVASMLALGAVTEPRTAVAGVHALPAGGVATYRRGLLSIDRYWSAQDAPPPLAPRDRRQAARELRPRLEDSVRRHLDADVPAGVFLSGGIDSSAIAALAARERPGLRTVSVAFDDPAYDESPGVDAVLARIGGAHTRVRLSASNLLDALPAAFDAMDQPSCDGLNTYVVSRAAREAGLKVALSGLGADELFDGYGHARRERALTLLASLPLPLRRLAGDAMAPLLPGNTAKLRAWCDGRFDGAPLALLRSVFLPHELRALVPGAPLPRAAFASDLDGYLRDVLLRDTDAMSMAHSLEVRVPYLDTPLVQWALALPPAVRGRRKALLRAAVADLLPAEVLLRRKQGFAIPYARWLRGELRDIARETLAAPPRLLAGVVDARAGQAAWQRFVNGDERWLPVWTLFSLYRWAASLEAIAAAPARGTRAVRVAVPSWNAGDLAPREWPEAA